LIFKEGNYNQATAKTVYLKKELSYILDKMEHLHKATTNSPVYLLNIFFLGITLVFCDFFFLDVFAAYLCF